MIGIVIINYNTWEATIQCIDSIMEVCSVPFHIYVIDNHSPNESLQQLNKKYTNSGSVTVIDSGRNGGYGFGLNCGIKVAILHGCDAVVASNNDIVYRSGAIEEMYRALKSSPEIVIAGAQQISPTGERQLSADKHNYSQWRLLLWHFPFIHRFNTRKKRNDRLLLQAEEVQEVAYPLGGCYMIDASILKNIKLYDENVFMYTEEFIIGIKLRKMLKRAVLCPKAIVVHHHGLTTGRDAAQCTMLSAWSRYYLCYRYTNTGAIGLFAHKSLYYILTTMKCLFLSDYRKQGIALFTVFQNKNITKIGRSEGSIGK